VGEGVGDLGMDDVRLGRAKMGLGTLDKSGTVSIEDLLLNLGFWGAEQIKNQPISRLRHTAIQTGKNIIAP